MFHKGRGGLTWQLVYQQLWVYVGKVQEAVVTFIAQHGEASVLVCTYAAVDHTDYTFLQTDWVGTVPKGYKLPI